MEEEIARVQIPKLTMTNWSTDFKNSFKDLALNYGDAGDIINHNWN